MAVRLYFDHNFYGPIIEQLRRRDVYVVTALEDGASQTDDADLLDRATALGCALVTGDDDLKAETARRQRADARFAGVIYCHQDDQRAVGPRVAELELIAKTGDPDDLANQLWYLPL